MTNCANHTPYCMMQAEATVREELEKELNAPIWDDEAINQENQKVTEIAKQWLSDGTKTCYCSDQPLMTNCAKCAKPTDPLEVFPGEVCLTCWAASPEGQRMPTAEELIAMWGGPA